MIDEADEFVAGPQNKKRGNSSDSNLGVTLKRRRSMSPLLRRPQTPPGNTNHVMVGKSPAGVPGQQNLIKPIPQHKGKTICIMCALNCTFFCLNGKEIVLNLGCDVHRSGQQQCVGDRE